MTKATASNGIQMDPWSLLEIDHINPISCGAPSEPTITAAPSIALRRKPASPNSNQPARNDNRATDEILNQYYTDPEVAEELFGAVLNRFDITEFLTVEPSAGEGAFFKLLPVGSLGYDLDPKFPGVETADFLTIQITGDRRVIIIGNPPFGRMSNGAVDFFNYAASQQVVVLIAFILPKTFRKTRIINRLNRAFHLLREEPVPSKAFTFRGKPYDVPTVFQIWERRDGPRARLPEVTSHPDFEFTTKDLADFAIQRVGADAGRVHKNFKLEKTSHYFIRGDVEDIMRELAPQFAKVAGNTAGCPSLAKSEIVTIYSERIASR